MNGTVRRVRREPGRAMSREVLFRQAPRPYRTLAYGTHRDQVVDLWPAPRDGAPLVLIVHGGFWRAEYDRRHVRPMANALAAAGYAVAAAEYRRTGTPGGGWPGTFDDIAAVADATAGLAARLGADPRRQVWAGHSAGGHLALWAASRHRLPQGSPWHAARPEAAVLSLAGCASPTLAALWDLDEGAARALLGGTPEGVPERYAAADPGWLLPTGVRVTLVHGTADEQIPVAMSRTFTARARRLGDPVSLVELPGVEHFALIDPRSAAWPEVLAALAGLAGPAR
ncbi:alpha/beta hydrolase family protein [Streptomyces abikoensis]|uniref:alpha/beta hydrolase family protein n=1 Tax=Streptomyces abikoensis TaxID=97398 RepID=UPI0033CD2BAF